MIMTQDIGVFLSNFIHQLRRNRMFYIHPPSILSWFKDNMKKCCDLVSKNNHEINILVNCDLVSKNNHEINNFVKKRKIIFLSQVIEAWRYYIEDRGSITNSFYGRINAYDLKAIRAMVRKDDNPSRLIKYSLAIMFDFKGGYPLRNIWQQTSDPNLLRYIPGKPTYNSWDISDTGRSFIGWNLRSESIDTVSRNFRRDGEMPRPASPGQNTYIARINHLEEVSLKILRFLLKKGANPNDKYFIANMIFKHKYHSRTFLYKVVSMCSHYGLESNTMLKALKLDWIRDYDYQLSYFIGPVLNIHKNKLNIKDTINFCYSWVSKKNLLKATNSNFGKLSKLNDDVLGIIHSFVYNLEINQDFEEYSNNQQRF